MRGVQTAQKRAASPGRFQRERISAGGVVDELNPAWEWKATQREPWVVRSERRRRNRIARASRKANR